MYYMQRRVKDSKHSIFVKAVSCVAVFAMMLPLCAGAAEVEEVVYTASAENIRIKGSIDTPYGVAAVMILPEGTTPETITPDIINSEKYVLKSVTADDKGAYTISITMPEWSDSGAYNVYVSDENGTDTESFTHFNNRKVIGVVNEINKASDADAVYAILSEGAAELAISADDFDSYGNSYAAGLFNGLPANGYTVDTIMIELNKVYTLCILPGLSAEDAEALIAECDTDFGFDYEKDFKNKEEQVKIAVLSSLLSADITKASADEIFYSNYILGVINESISYMDVVKALKSYGERIGLDLTDFNKLSSYKQGEVAQSLMKASPVDTKEIISDLKSAVSDINSESGSSSSGGGSRGGSGGGGGSYKNDFSVDTQLADNIGNTSAKITFDDINNHWSKDIVNQLASKGIVNGFEDGNFYPDGYVTRAEFAKLIINALGIQTSAGNDFSDVNRNDWFYSYVYAAKNASLINGFEGMFRPDDRITREECAAIIYRALVRDGKTPEGTYEFSDSDNIADYAKECVSALAASGLLRGDGTGFAPKSNTTRAEAASMIFNLLDYTGRG